MTKKRTLRENRKSKNKTNKQNPKKEHEMSWKLSEEDVSSMKERLSDVSNSAYRSRLRLNVDIKLSNMKVSEDLHICCFGGVVSLEKIGQKEMRQV